MHAALPPLIPDQDDCRLQVLPMDEATIGPYLTKRSKDIVIGVVDRYAVLLEGAMPGEQVIEINKIRGKVQLAVHNQ